MTRLNWKASERCLTTPVPSSDRSLENVKFRLTANETPTTDEMRRLDEPQQWHRFSPELFLDVDANTLIADTGLPRDGIVLSVIVRDRELGKFERIGEWSLDELPDDVLSLGVDLERFSCSTPLDVVVVASPHGQFRNGDSMPIPHGTLLASKVFKIRAPSRGVDFPFKFVEPDEMVKAGFARSTVCCVRWRGEDISRSPSELIEVWLNKELEDKFRVLNAKHGGAAADHIARSIGAHVYADVLAQILGSDEHSDEPDSLVSIVKDMIERELGLTLEEARQIFQEGPDGRSRLVPWCWTLTQADRSFAGITL